MSSPEQQCKCADPSVRLDDLLKRVTTLEAGQVSDFALIMTERQAAARAEMARRRELGISYVALLLLALVVAAAIWLSEPNRTRLQVLGLAIILVTFSVIVRWVLRATFGPVDISADVRIVGPEPAQRGNADQPIASSQSSS